MTERDGLVEGFRREVRDKLYVAHHTAENPHRTHREIVMRQCEDFLVEQFESGLQAKADALSAAQRSITANVSELRAGEENDGPLESTDLFITGRGLSLLINVPAESVCYYSLGVDEQETQSGTVGQVEAALLSERSPTQEETKENTDGLPVSHPPDRRGPVTR